MPHENIDIDNTENVVSIKISLTALIGKEKPELYVSYCPALDLYSQGATEQEAGDNIIEAVQLLIESCIEDHTLEQVLGDCGFSLAARSRPGKPVAREAGLPHGFATARKIAIPDVTMVAHG